MTHEPNRCQQCDQPLTQIGQFWICPQHGPVSLEKPLAPLRIFLSYGHEGNEELVRRIHADLEERAHDVWIDKSEIKFGDDWRRSITEGTSTATGCCRFRQKFRLPDAEGGWRRRFRSRYSAASCLTGHEDHVWSVTFSPDGRRIASGSRGTVRVWDAVSGECLGMIRGARDAAMIAAGAPRFPWRAIKRSQETVLEPTAGGSLIAWFPVAIEFIATHPNGRSWAGGVANNLCLLTLEKAPDGGRYAEGEA